MSVPDKAPDDDDDISPVELVIFSRKRHSCSRQKGLKYLVYVLICSTAVLCGLFLMYFFKYQQKVASEVCETAGCVIAASQVADKMDASANPCDDFVQFACGNFYRTATYSEGKTYIMPFSTLEEANKKVIKSILSEDDREETWSYVSNMKRFYKACLDEASIEQIGLRPYLDSPFAQEWPTLIGRNWSQESTFDLNDVNSKYMAYSIQPIFSISIAADIMNSTKHALSLGDPRLSLSRKILRKPRNSTEIMAFEHYLVKMAVELGAEPAVAAEDAKAVLDLDCEIAKILVPEEERRNFSKEYNPMTLAALGEKYTFLDIPRAIRAAFAVANVSLEDDQEVIVKYPAVLHKLETVLNTTQKRTLQNSFGFKYAYTRTHELTKRLRKISLSLDRILYGKTEEEPRIDHCVDRTISVFQFGIGKEFIQRIFPENFKIYIHSMIDKLQAEFQSQLQTVSWLGEKTKAEAYRKLTFMTRKIGYPDKEFNDEDIEKKYEDLTMSPDQFYNNLETVRLQDKIRALSRLRDPTDKDEWITGPHVVNAFYDFSKNSIFFPAGILQPPFFSAQYPDSLNYGAIGVVIGHEITHGFDDQGSQFDQHGNLRNWWQSRDFYNFKQAGQCFVHQYGNFTDESVGMKVNGITTQGENVADNGGLKQSYRAFKKLMAEKGEPKRLPGLGLTNDQTFFLGYAQNFRTAPKLSRVCPGLQLSPWLAHEPRKEVQRVVMVALAINLSSPSA
ncbi:endothelin-converting enzyme 1 [Plakobranchus ocellatus]|uniref:Endothelin-converting enzyme 1 n=1 Tax=Plakobranchus ocellatus TaxID=259542 RepID=A0AAV3ZMR5_9GAST|nr:endothelin-converting enzyme 1 [Plakobranchus ocellatus]